MQLLVGRDQTSIAAQLPVGRDQTSIATQLRGCEREDMAAVTAIYARHLAPGLDIGDAIVVFGATSKDWLA